MFEDSVVVFGHKQTIDDDDVLVYVNTLVPEHFNSLNMKHIWWRYK